MAGDITAGLTTMTSSLNIYPPRLITLASYGKRRLPIASAQIAFRLVSGQPAGLFQVETASDSAVVKTLINHGACDVLILMSAIQLPWLACCLN